MYDACVDIVVAGDVRCPSFNCCMWWCFHIVTAHEIFRCCFVSTGMTRVLYGARLSSVFVVDPLVV